MTKRASSRRSSVGHYQLHMLVGSNVNFKIYRFKSQRNSRCFHEWSLRKADFTARNYIRQMAVGLGITSIAQRPKLLNMRQGLSTPISFR